MFITWAMREAIENALGRGHCEFACFSMFAAHSFPSDVDLSTVNSSSTGWSSGCPPGTPLNPSSAMHAEVLPRGKSFVADIRASMDPCYNTELISLSTLGDYPAGVKPADKLYPAMSRAKTELHADIVAPTIEGWGDEEDDVPWEKKEDHHALWRGRTTGREFAPTWEDWKTGQRLRLDDITNAHSGTVSVLPPPSDENDALPPIELDAKTVNEYWFDVGIIDTVQCPPDFCQKIKDGYVFKGGADGNAEKHHKFIIDVDGNSTSRCSAAWCSYLTFPAQAGAHGSAVPCNASHSCSSPRSIPNGTVCRRLPVTLADTQPVQVDRPLGALGPLCPY